MKHYRFAAHVFCVVAVLLMGYLILRFRVINVGFWHLVVLLVVIYAIVTWFVEIHADAAEGIQTSFLAEHYSSEGYPYMQKCIPVIISLFRVTANSWSTSGRARLEMGTADIN